MFLSSPGDGLDDKAKSFWKLCQFTKMDDMNKDFNTSSLLWKNPGFENWDNECPLRDSFRTDEFIEKKNVIQKVRESSPLAAQELIEMGLKGPQIGTVLSQIRGKTPEQAREIARMYLTNEAKTWIKSFDRFRK
jgi:hypothetical protein